MPFVRVDEPTHKSVNRLAGALEHRSGESITQGEAVTHAVRNELERIEGDTGQE